MNGQDQIYVEELEYKYRANNISLSSFRDLMNRLPIIDRKQVSSWDVYYIQKNDPDSFQRFRMDREKPELTKKIKTLKTNNWSRIESDLALDPLKISEKAVSYHVGLDGYLENFRIYKYCEVFFEDFINWVYYIVYNADMEEVDRFIEVEINKNMVPMLINYHASSPEQMLIEAELILAQEFGINSQSRLKKSLFEMYRKV